MIFKNIFRPLQIGSLTIENRLIMPAMGDNHGNPDHTMNDRARAYYAERSKGGFGLVMTEVTAVTADGWSLAHEHGIWDDSFIPGFAKLAEEIHHWGGKLCIQLHHAGRETIGEQTPVAPSAIKMVASPYFPSRIPRELTTDEVWNLIEAYGDAAVRAKKAGADAVEVHGAHQYLVAQFLSPASNKRTDEFGGNFENRMRFATEIIKNIKKKCGEKFPVIVRISGEERAEGGRTVLQSKVVAKALECAGADAIHVSVGNGSTNATVAPASYPEGHILKDAAEIKKSVKIPVIGVGRMHDPYLIDMVLEEGLVDAVSVGRQAIADPFFPNKLKTGNTDEICPCISCLQGCVGRVNDPRYLGVNCLVNPFAGREAEWKITPAEHKKKIVVVGAGAGGMEFSRIAAMRGHEVVLFEKSDRVGGLALLAAMPPHKQKISEAIRYWETSCRRKGVDIRLNTEATVELIKNEKPDAVVLANGAHSVHPPFKGLDKNNAVDSYDVLAGKVDVGFRTIVIGGGLVGCEMTTYLLNQGHDVAIVEMKPELVPEMELWEKWTVQDTLAQIEEKARVLTGAKVIEILADGLVYEKEDGTVGELHRYDSIIMACGSKPDQSFDEKLDDIAEVYKIGDAKKAPGNIITSTEDAGALAIRI